MTYAIDFETTYIKGVRDASSLGVYPYLRHPETDIYLVSIVGPGVWYCGHPMEAPWETISGHHWVAHNAAFDSACFDVLKEQGVVEPELGPSDWDCTSDLAAYSGSGRSLQAAAQALLNIPLDKTTRDKMAGKSWSEMTPQFREEVINYALADAENCLTIWERFSPFWPAEQQALSRHTREMCKRGVGVDSTLVETGIVNLKKIQWELVQKIPWAGTLDAKGKEIAITSVKALRKACEAVGIPPPATTEAKSDIFLDWCAKYADKAAFVKAIGEYRSVSRTLDVLEKTRDRTGEDGRMSYSLKYYGGHTGRWSGDSGFNIQNLSKKTIGGVNLRHSFIPAPGNKFIVSDLKQIEARVALWVAGDKAQLDMVRSGMCIYEAHARLTMGYKDPMKFSDWVKQPNCPNPKMRDFAKCRRLGLQFGLGATKFMSIAKEWANLVLSPAVAKETVYDFRKKEWRIVQAWDDLGRALDAAAGKGAPFDILLPSGRSLHYYDVHREHDPVLHREITKVRYTMTGEFVNTWGGTLFENCVAGDMEVLTRRGWVRLDSVLPTDEVWDGIEFVGHEGLLDRGERETINCHGVIATPDHQFLTTTGWMTAEAILQNGYQIGKTKGEPLGVFRPDREGFREFDCYGTSWLRREEHSVASKVSLRELNHQDNKGFEATCLLREGVPGETSSTPDPRFIQTSGVRSLALHETEVPRFKTSGLQKLRRAWNRGLRKVARLLRGFLVGYGANLGSGDGPRSDRQRRGLYGGELSVDHPQDKLPEQTNHDNPSLGSRQRCEEWSEAKHSVLQTEPRLESGSRLRLVYDLLNCGPRHRFAVRAPGSNYHLIAHNCVQAISADLLGLAVLRIEAAGYPVVLHVHDEVVVEVPIDTPVDCITELMTITPEWAEGLPVGSDSYECLKYEKH